MGGVDHQAVSCPGVSRQFPEDLVKDPRSAPADKPVVKCLVRAIGFRRILPLKAVPDPKEDPAEHPSVIRLRDTGRHRKIGLDSVQLLLVNRTTSLMATSSRVTHGLLAMETLKLNES